MVKLNRIYTRTGDAGTTGLVDGSRLSKAHSLMTAIGDVDEANCAVGVALLSLDGPMADTYSRVQNELFDLGADLATPFGTDEEPEWALRVTDAQVARLEAEIDGWNEGLAPLNSFILPGGSPAVAALHTARAVTRRAERAAVAVQAGGGADAEPGGADLSQPPERPPVRRLPRGGRRRRGPVGAGRQPGLSLQSLRKCAEFGTSSPSQMGRGTARRTRVVEGHRRVAAIGELGTITPPPPASLAVPLPEQAQAGWACAAATTNASACGARPEPGNSALGAWCRRIGRCVGPPTLGLEGRAAAAPFAWRRRLTLVVFSLAAA